jgi:hypothetical protein
MSKSKYVDREKKSEHGRQSAVKLLASTKIDANHPSDPSRVVANEQLMEWGVLIRYAALIITISKGELAHQLALNLETVEVWNETICLMRQAARQLQVYAELLEAAEAHSMRITGMIGSLATPWELFRDRSQRVTEEGARR